MHTKDVRIYLYITHLDIRMYFLNKEGLLCDKTFARHGDLCLEALTLESGDRRIRNSGSFVAV